jgi:hypothetical protein
MRESATANVRILFSRGYVASPTKLLPNATHDSPVVKAMPHRPSTEILTGRLLDGRRLSSVGADDSSEAVNEAGLSLTDEEEDGDSDLTDEGAVVTPNGTTDNKYCWSFMTVVMQSRSECGLKSGSVNVRSKVVIELKGECR